MAQELFYTSSPRGLRLGVSGYCTVACTNGMAANYIEVLESLSGYAPVFPPNHPQAVLNPVAYSHYRYTIGGKVVNILSRVGFAGVDYTQRANKFAHHLVLDISERAAGGPAWVMQQPGVMAEKWVGPPKYLDLPKKMPGGDSVPARCSAWERCTGDAGWGGVLAQSFLDNAREPAFIIFEAGMPTLNLVSEAIRLLPKEARWSVTFNTYFTSLPIGTSCAWRFCLKDDPALKQARRTPGALIIDLTAGADQPAEARSRMSKGSAFIEFARSGVPPAVTSKPGPLPRENPELQLLPEPPPSNLPPAITLPPSHSVKRVRTQAPQADIPSSGYVAARPNPLVAVLAVLLVLSLGGNLFLFFFYRPRSASDAKGHTTAPVTGSQSIPKSLTSAPTGATSGTGGDIVGQGAPNRNPNAGTGAPPESPHSGATEVHPTPSSSAQISPQVAVTTVQGVGQNVGTDLTPYQPSSRPVRLLAKLNEIDKIANSVSQNGQKELLVHNIPPNSHIKPLGLHWWDEKPPAKGVSITYMDDKVGFVCDESGLTPVTVLTVFFDSQSSQVIFKPDPRAQRKQIEKIDLKSLGWIQLWADDKTEYVVFTSKRPDDKEAVKLSFDSNSGFYKGTFEIPEVLRRVDQITLKGADQYSLSHENDEKGYITITLRPKDAKKKPQDEHINDAAIEFNVDGNVVASYALVYVK